MKYHHPPHIFLDNMCYFITARTYEGRKIFNTDENKALLLRSLKAEVRRSGFVLYAWVVLDDHYHILLQCGKSRLISKMINRVHGRVSFLINKDERKRGRKIFQNYWDHCIRDQEDFNNHVRYIEYNPVKHGYVDDAKEYTFVQIYPLDKNAEK